MDDLGIRGATNKPNILSSGKELIHNGQHYTKEGH